MTIPRKSLMNGFSMPVFGLGTWRMGGDTAQDPDNDDAADIESIERAVASGVTHIDTAEMYADGHAEELVAEAIGGTKREELFIVSKVKPEHLRYDDLLRAADGSLSRLEMDYLDLYLIHHPNEGIPIEETMRAMTRLVDEGIVRAIGVSNFVPGRWAEAQKHTPHPLVLNQVHYSLKCREPESTGLVDYAKTNDRFVEAWRPVMWMSQTDDTKLLDQVCRKYGKTRSQIAINWLISQQNVTTLAKMGTAAHLEENLGAIGWEMEQEDVELLRRDFPQQIEVSDSVPLR